MVALGRDPGPAILEDLLEELEAAPLHVLTGTGSGHVLLNAIDPMAAALEGPNEDDEDDDEAEDVDYCDESDYVYEDEEEGYQASILIAVAVEPDPAEPDEVEVEVELGFDDLSEEALEALPERPEHWVEYSDHWDDRAIDPNDKVADVRWPDPEHRHDVAHDVERRIAEPACPGHGILLDECNHCSAWYCVQCTGDGALCTNCPEIDEDLIIEPARLVG
ncbi:MAG: hypothetical protein ABI867_00520 [Kofleriaceae bacterium]